MPRFRRDTVQKRVLAVEELATLPASLARILAITQDPNSTSLDLAAEIAKDPALTAKVLRTVNSSFYGFQRRIQTVSDSVVLLGYTEVERLALAISVINLFGGELLRARFLHQLWRHSFVASIAADIVAEAYMPGIPELSGAHVAALLHDIGKAVLAQCIPEAAPAIAQLMDNSGLSCLEAEAQILDGFTHCEVGAWVAERWSLPVSIIECILLHHAPDQATEEHPMLHATHVANAVCYELGVPAITELAEPPAVCPRSFEYLHVDGAFTSRVEERIQKRRDLISMITTGVAI